MKIRVQCYAGHRGEEETRALYLAERRIAVMEVIDRWLSPDHRYFDVDIGLPDTRIIPTKEQFSPNDCRRFY